MIMPVITAKNIKKAKPASSKIFVFRFIVLVFFGSAIIDLVGLT